jgi:hypothetical protein
MSDDDDGGLIRRLRGQRDWKNAIRNAERSGDLKEIAALIRSCAYMGFSAEKLARLFDDHRLVRQKRGNWKSIFEPSAQTKYAAAAAWVRSIEVMKRDWEKVKGEDWAKGMTLKMIKGEWAKDRTSFKLNEDYLDDIDDPVAYVARKSGLNAEKLWSAMQGRIGFGRGRYRDARRLEDVNPTSLRFEDPNMTNFLFAIMPAREPKLRGSASK